MKMFLKLRIPYYGYFGFMLVLVFWYLNWNLEGLRTHVLFFPLWFGYILAVDAITFQRKGTSFVKRNKKLFLLLFIFSAPSWWMFELINLRTQNWFYFGRQFFTDIEYALLATISFSTVMPAVFCTAELAGTFKVFSRFQKLKKIKVTNIILWKFLITGIVMLILIIIFPSLFYYLEWASVYFILEPINFKLKNKTLLSYINQGNWMPIILLSSAALFCGFFWEMWNYNSYPKWIYDVPMVNFLHIFEMPLFGYIGYIPFSWELFTMYNFLIGIIKKFTQNNFELQISSMNPIINT